jgi:hypothetical protein
MKNQHMKRQTTAVGWRRNGAPQPGEGVLDQAVGGLLAGCRFCYWTSKERRITERRITEQ